jgi:hypothetical protein
MSRRKWFVFAPSALIAAVTICCAYEITVAETWQQFESKKLLKDGYPLSNDATQLVGSATLATASPKFKLGEAANVELLFHVGPVSPGGFVFNPVWHPLYPRSAVICLYDSEKKLAYEWDGPRGGSRKEIDADAWVAVTAGAVVGTAQTIRIPAADEATIAGGSFKPGKYYLQAIYLKAFIGLSELNGHRTVYGPADGEKLMHGFDSTELFRSNILEVELVR